MAKKKRSGPSFGQGDTKWFVDARFGLFIHWGTYALAARHEWVKHNERTTNEEYQKYFDHFDPDLYDPKEWASHFPADSPTRPLIIPWNSQIIYPED